MPVTIFTLWNYLFNTFRRILRRINPLNLFRFLYTATRRDIGSEDTNDDNALVTSSKQRGIRSINGDASRELEDGSNAVKLSRGSPTPPPSSPPDAQQSPIVDASSRAYDSSDVKNEMDRPDVTVCEIKRMIQTFDYVKEVQEGALDRLSKMTLTESDVKEHDLVKLVVTIMKCYRRRSSIQSKACRVLCHLTDVSGDVREQVLNSGAKFEAIRAQSAFPSDATLTEESNAFMRKFPSPKRVQSVIKQPYHSSDTSSRSNGYSLSSKSRSLGL